MAIYYGDGSNSNNGRVHPGDFFYLMNYNTSKTFRNMYEKINPN